MDSPAPTCALCDRTLAGATPAHAIHDKLICEACRRLVSAREPRQVLPYSAQGVRRRRWLLPIAASIVAVSLLLALLLAARQFARQRAQAEMMRAQAARLQVIAAHQRSMLARDAEQHARLAATQPAD